MTFFGKLTDWHVLQITAFLLCATSFYEAQSRLSQYFKWNLTQRLACAEQFWGSSSYSLQEYELEQLLHLKLVTKRNKNTVNTSEEKNRAITDLGWNHLQHTRIAVALVRGNFLLFFSQKNNRKFARAKATADTRMLQMTPPLELTQPGMLAVFPVRTLQPVNGMGCQSILHRMLPLQFLRFRKVERFASAHLYTLVEKANEE